MSCDCRIVTKEAGIPHLCKGSHFCHKWHSKSRPLHSTSYLLQSTLSVLEQIKNIVLKSSLKGLWIHYNEAGNTSLIFGYKSGSNSVHQSSASPHCELKYLSWSCESEYWSAGIWLVLNTVMTWWEGRIEKEKHNNWKCQAETQSQPDGAESSGPSLKPHPSQVRAFPLLHCHQGPMATLGGCDLQVTSGVELLICNNLMTDLKSCCKCSC